MADTKISALPASTVPLAGTEVLPIVQSSTTKQVSVSNLTAGRSFDALGMTLTSTDAGATAAPLLELYRDSASPAASDTLGEIEFNGEDSAGNKQAYALFHASILSPTSGAEQGQLHFETATAGALTEKMIIGTNNLVINEIGAVFNVRIEGDTDANLFYTDATNSRIGIGTITPTTKLDVAGASGTLARFKSTGNYSTVIADNDSTTGGGAFAVYKQGAQIGLFGVSGGILGDTSADIGMFAETGSSLKFYTNGSASVKALIDTNGNLGVGETSIPSYTRLAVKGTAGAQTDAKQQIIVNAPTTTAGEGAGIRINAASGANESVGVIGVVNNASGNLGSMTFHVYNGGVTVPEYMRISNAGIVTMSAYGAGAATFSAAGVISSVSDETWKVKDGVPTDPDAMLKKLEPGYWFYNDEKKEIFGVDRQLGFYAQNVNAAIGPEAAPVPETSTIKNNDGTESTVTKPWGYYDRSVLAVTVMSLQKALATIDSLNARITALEGA